MPTRRVEMRIALSALALTAGSTVALAQSDAPSAEGARPASRSLVPAKREPSNAQLLADFIHYVLIDRNDLAAAMGQTLLDKKLPPKEFVKLVEGTQGGVSRFQTAVVRAQRRAEVERVAGALLALYEESKKSSARSPDDVAANIKLLSGTQSQQIFARTQLIAAGEYAVPQLLQALLDRGDMLRAVRAREVLSAMGQQAVVPLTTALPDLDPASQQTVISVLAEIPQPTSVPFLYDVASGTSSGEVRAEAERAITRITGSYNNSIPLAQRYTNLADDYLKESRSLTSFPDDASQLWWTFDPGAGLVMQAVETKVFHEGMAMRLAEKALRKDGSAMPAVSTWLAANMRREIQGTESVANPSYGKDRRDAMYYAVAAGNQPSQNVLARALDENDTQLARKALAAIDRTAGGSNLWTAAGTRRPLVEALRFPNRRVQYEAALALGAAQPKTGFDGSDQIVRLLAGAIRDANARYALILAADTERQNSLTEIFKSQGYTIMPAAVRLDDARQAIADVPAVDLIVSDLPPNATGEMIAAAQGDPKLRATPVLALVPGEGSGELRNRFGRDKRVELARAGLSPAEIGAAAEQLMTTSIGGPITADEAAAYKNRSLAVLRDLAMSGNTVLSIADASGPLVTALKDDANKGPMQLKIADVLAFVPTRDAQENLADAALAAESGPVKIAMLNAVAQSAKRNGNLLAQRHVDSIVALAKDGKGEEATAAAALMGSLNLPGTDLVPLILGSK